MGQANLRRYEVTKSIASAGLKITPDVFGGGGSDGANNNVFGAFIARLLDRDRLNGATNNGHRTNGNGANGNNQ